MKKGLLIIGVFCSLFSMQLRAQDCKMCGDWTGTVWKKYSHNTKSDGDGDWRMGKMTQFIRIQRFGDEYKIRLKHRFEEGDVGTVYVDEETTILNSTDTSLYFQTVSGFSCNYDEYDRITDCYRIQMFFLITYHNGYIHYELKSIDSLNYDRHKRYMGTTHENLSSWVESFPEYDLDLFRGDDW